METRFAKDNSSIRGGPDPAARSPINRSSYAAVTDAEGLSRPHACSLAVGPASVSCYEPRLVFSVSHYTDITPIAGGRILPALAPTKGPKGLKRAL